MKEENLKKVKEAIMDEFNASGKLAEFCAKAAMDGVKNALLATANMLFEEQNNENES